VNLRYVVLLDNHNYSGSTVCTVLFNGTKIYCGNAGDSRAIKVAFSQEYGGSIPRKSKILFL